METLVVVAHHRNHQQYYGRNHGQGTMKFGSFGSAPSGNFRGINCRTFHESREGLLPTRSKSCSTMTTVSKKAFSPSLSPKTPSLDEHPKTLKRLAKSSSVPVPIKINFEKKGDFSFSERYAGPAYSNSPPPSSLPIPKFSLRPKRIVSLELTAVVPEIDLRPIAKSAPTSPMRERHPSPGDLFDSDVSATETLRRILNLDVADE